MARITIVLGILLIVLGLIAYFALATGDERSVTALIPAFFGVPLAVLGVAALGGGAKRRMVLMHVAVVLAVLGIAGTARAIVKVPALFSDPDSLARPKATAVQAIMFGLCLVYVVLAVRSFIAARRSGS